MEMANNQTRVHLKRLNGQNEVLMEMNIHTDYNIVAKRTHRMARIGLTVKPNIFYSKICQPFFQALIGMLNAQKLS